MYREAIVWKRLLPTVKVSSEKIALAYLRIVYKMAVQRRAPVWIYRQYNQTY